MATVKEAGSFNFEKSVASIKVGDTIRGRWKANEQGLGAYKGLTIQIQNGERLIVWPAHMAEAKVVAMPKWEGRGKK